MRTFIKLLDTPSITYANLSRYATISCLGGRIIGYCGDEKDLLFSGSEEKAKELMGRIREAVCIDFGL